MVDLQDQMLVPMLARDWSHRNAVHNDVVKSCLKSLGLKVGITLTTIFKSHLSSFLGSLTTLRSVMLEQFRTEEKCYLKLTFLNACF